MREEVADDAFSVVDRTVEQVIGEKRGLWLTFGVAFALWQVSGAVRATIRPLNVIYGAEEKRPLWHRLLISGALAVTIGPLVVGAALTIQLGPRVLRALPLPAAVEYPLYVLRWGVAIAFLACAVWLLIRFAPAERQSFAWAGLGSVFVVVAWIGASLAFGFYATAIADYGNVFGSLASLIVLLTYIYVSSAALMFGVQLDACVREHVAEGKRTR